MKKVLVFTCLVTFGYSSIAQGPSSSSIQDLNFLIGTWEVREDNKEKSWWEESTRKICYTLDSAYIELRASANSSGGKSRTYLWLIHYNQKDQQFEMISMFSNWHKIQYDILSWDKSNRTLTIESGGDPGSNEYHERFGEIVFSEDFNTYTWKGRNKYGDENNPNIWEYVEKGSRIASPD
ncbi:hypothetical protein AAOE16_07840 [Ekhidna sp. MALMAid0563]|uniref:hypothetical protein n=1 Tax=Ekhidna sp. MALMAid0563 TaxID=3143937 RepID=UPI0032DF4FBD